MGEIYVGTSPMNLESVYRSQYGLYLDGWRRSKTRLDDTKMRADVDKMDPD